MSGSPDMRFTGQVLVSGAAHGYSLVLEDTLSFWGGFEPKTGEIIDVHHPQYSQKVSGSVLFIPASRGSAGTPGGIAESLRVGSGPAAFVLIEPDVNISIGAYVANRLYRLNVPVLQIQRSQLDLIETGDWIWIKESGLINVSPPDVESTRSD